MEPGPGMTGREHEGEQSECEFFMGTYKEKLTKPMKTGTRGFPFHAQTARRRFNPQPQWD